MVESTVAFQDRPGFFAVVTRGYRHDDAAGLELRLVKLRMIFGNSPADQRTADTDNRGPAGGIADERPESACRDRGPDYRDDPRQDSQSHKTADARAGRHANERTCSNLIGFDVGSRGNIRLGPPG